MGLIGQRACVCGGGMGLATPVVGCSEGRVGARDNVEGRRSAMAQQCNP